MVSWYSIDVIRYDTEKLNIDIPLYSFGGAIRVKSARVSVCFVVSAINLMNNKCYKISCLICRKHI